MADRGRLHVSRLDAFKEYLEQNGWVIEHAKGVYEALRARKAGRQHPLIIFSKGSGVHLSVMNRDIDVLEDFLKEPVKARTNADCIRSMTDEELVAIIDCRLLVRKGVRADWCDQHHHNCSQCKLAWLKSIASGGTL